MRQPQLIRHVVGHCRGTVAFADVAAAHDEGYDQLASVVGLRFGDFAGD